MSRLRLAAALAACLAPHALADDGKPRTLGHIDGLDATFADLVAKDAVIELLVADTFEWAEGPVWLPKEKAVLFSDIPRNMAWKWTPGVGIERFLQPSGYTGKEPFAGREPGCNGLALDKEGTLILCQHGDRRVAKLVDKKFVTLADKYDGKRLNSPNDLVIHSTGDIYFTDPPYGLPGQMKDQAKELDFQGVYRLAKDGKVTLLTKEMSRPNGIALSPDEKTLYVANSDPEKAVWMSFPVKDDGTLGEGKLFFDSTKSVGPKNPGLPDGMKVDKSGNVWATGPGGVLVFSAAGKHLGTLATGVPTANCGWGDDGSTLYITADKNLCRVKTKVKGW